MGFFGLVAYNIHTRKDWPRHRMVEEQLAGSGLASVRGFDSTANRCHMGNRHCLVQPWLWSGEPDLADTVLGGTWWHHAERSLPVVFT